MRDQPPHQVDRDGQEEIQPEILDPGRQPAGRRRQEKITPEAQVVPVEEEEDQHHEQHAQAVGVPPQVVEHQSGDAQDQQEQRRSFPGGLEARADPHQQAGCQQHGQHADYLAHDRHDGLGVAAQPAP